MKLSTRIRRLLFAIKDVFMAATMGSFFLIYLFSIGLFGSLNHLWSSFFDLNYDLSETNLNIGGLVSK